MLVTQYQSEFALHARAILGLPVSTALNRSAPRPLPSGGMDAKGIAFEGVAEALADPETGTAPVAEIRQTGLKYAAWAWRWRR